LYLGPSWAVQSYESWNGDTDTIKTNLAQELRLENYTQLANYSESNMRQLNRAIEFMQQHPELAPFRLLFVMSSSLHDAPVLRSGTREEFAMVFLRSKNPIDLLQDLERGFYDRICQLGIPVGLIGAHTDVVDYDFPPHVTVIHPSWQNFLGNQSGLDPFLGWPCEIANLWLQGRLDYGRHIPMVDPSKELVFEIDQQFKRWDILEQNKLWCGVHPNLRGNQLFAKHIADSFNKWIDNVA